MDGQSDGWTVRQTDRQTTGDQKSSDDSDDLFLFGAYPNNSKLSHKTYTPYHKDEMDTDDHLKNKS